MKKTNITIKIKRITRCRGQILVGTCKTHSIDEFVIVVKYGGHVLHHLASRFVNVSRQAGRQAGRQTKNLVLLIF